MCLALQRDSDIIAWVIFLQCVEAHAAVCQPSMGAQNALLTSLGPGREVPPLKSGMCWAKGGPGVQMHDNKSFP